MRTVLKHTFILMGLAFLSVPSLAANKKTPQERKRIVNIYLGKDGIQAKRKPQNVVGKVVTHVPNTKAPQKTLLVDPQVQFGEHSFDPIKVKPSKKSGSVAASTEKSNRLNSNSSAEIQVADLEEAARSVASSQNSRLGSQSTADKALLKRIKRETERSLNEDYF